MRERFNWPEKSIVLETVDRGAGPGNILLIGEESEFVSEVAVGFGESGVSAENVARKAVEQMRHYLVSRAAVGEYLTDQLLLPCALAEGGHFTAASISKHTRTHAEIIARFLGRPFTFHTLPEAGFEVVY